MRRIIALLLLLAALAAPAAAAAQARSYSNERIDVEIDVRPDGVLGVAETYTYRFTGGPFRKALRGIAHDRLDRVTNISLSENGRPFRQSYAEDRGTFAVRESFDETLVTWFYEPTSDAARTFTLRYDVYGAVRADPEADEIWWVAVFPDRDAPVERASVTVRFPDGAALESTNVSLPAADGTLDVGPRTIALTRDTPLAPGQALELRADFDPDLIAAPAPAWQSAPAAPVYASEPERAEPGDPADGVMAVMMVLCVLFVIGNVAWRLANGEPVFEAHDDDSWSTSSSRRRSNWSSSRGSSSRSSFSSSRGSSSSSRGSSSRGGSGGGRGGAG